MEMQGREISEVPSAQRKKELRDTLIAAFSNLSTAYNLVNINLAQVIMEDEYCSDVDECVGLVTTAGTACLVGAIIGQMTFGYIGDCLGRNRALQLTMVLSIFGAAISALVVPVGPHKASSAFTFLSVSRLILGIGVGGVYPLAATIAAESSQDENRGRNCSLVFSMQGIGTLLVPLMGMVFLYGFGTYEDRHDSGKALPGISWRLLLGVGAVPGLLLMPFNKTSSSASAAPSASASNSNGRMTSGRQPLTLMQALRRRAYWKSLIGCAGGWFVFDITFYGNTLFQSSILKSVFHATAKQTPVIGHTLDQNLCLQLLIIALIGLPGYYVAVWLMDRMGRKKMQIQGFIMMALLYAILGLFFESLKKVSALLLIIYGLTFFFSNFGPNSTTFILPAESFPYEVRSSLNGFCAAMGKVGATLGSSLFKPMVKLVGAQSVFLACAACAVVGALITAVFVEDRRGQSLSQGEGFMQNVDGERSSRS